MTTLADIPLPSSLIVHAGDQRKPETVAANVRVAVDHDRLTVAVIEAGTGRVIEKLQLLARLNTPAA